MTEAEINEVITELDDVLETEREALLGGNLEVIGRLLERKEKLVEEISTLESAKASAMADVVDKLRRNQTLLEHAGEGIQSVATRLATLRRVREALDTYDSNGVKRSVQIAKERSVEKRA